MFSQIITGILNIAAFTLMAVVFVRHAKKPAEKLPSKWSAHVK